jgi:tetratricopeptide (TPR) repeat protein/transcriptional regulator with XRE-family HTH domain
MVVVLVLILKWYRLLPRCVPVCSDGAAADRRFTGESGEVYEVTGGRMFGEIVRAQRRRLSLTQEDLAHRTGISTRNIRYLESGRITRPRPPTVRLLAEAFGLDGAGRERFFAAAASVPSPPGRLVPAQLPLDVPGFIGRERELAELDALTTAPSRPATYLPLALRIAAAHITDRPHYTISQYLAQLTTGDRLSALSVTDDDQAAVRATFDLSYRQLPPEVQRVFRLLGLVPGADITADAAAALIAGDTEGTSLFLDRLTAVHLLDQPAAGRYRFHDLLRCYASERVHAENSEADRRAAVERLLHWYLRTADGATRLLYPQVVRLPPTLAASSGHVRFTDHAASLAWLDAERANLVAAARHAAEHGPGRVAWLLADALRGYFARQVHILDWHTTASAAAAAAEADNDPAGQAVAQLNLADVLRRFSRYEQAVPHYQRTLALSQEVGWLDGQATALANLGGVYLFLGRLAQAAEHLSQALRIDRETGRPGGEASRLNNLGIVYWQMGRLEQSAAFYRGAASIRAASGRDHGEASARSNLAEVYHALGRFSVARDQLDRAIDLVQQLGGQDDADALRVMAALCRDTGNHPEALKSAEAAVALASDTERDPRTEAHALVTLGTVRHHLGQYGAAIDLYRRALRLATETGNHFPQAEALIDLATAHLDRKQPGQAGRHANEALVIAQEIGYRMLEGRALTVLALVNLHRDRNDEAVDQAERALAIHRETGHRLGEAHALLVLARAQGTSTGVGAAGTYRRQAHKIFAEIGIPKAEDACVLLSSGVDDNGQRRPPVAREADAHPPLWTVPPDRQR